MTLGVCMNGVQQAYMEYTLGLMKKTAPENKLQITASCHLKPAHKQRFLQASDNSRQCYLVTSILLVHPNISVWTVRSVTKQETAWFCFSLFVLFLFCFVLFFVFVFIG